MKVKVLTEFVDKHTGELRKVGSSFECTDERLKEIRSVGSFVEVIESAAEEEKKTAKTAKKRTTKGE